MKKPKRQQLQMMTGTGLLDILQPRFDGDIPMVTLMQ